MNAFLDKNIKYIKGVGESRAKLFEKLGVTSVDTLLRFYPKDYDDWTAYTTVFDAPTGEPCFIRAKLTHPPEARFIRDKMTIYTAYAADENGASIKLTFFNNPYICKMLKSGEDYIFHGRLSFDFGSAQLNSPQFCLAEKAKITPKYQQTDKLTSRTIGQTVCNALSILPDPLPDPIPEQLRTRLKLCSLRSALQNIHMPQGMDALTAARRRLVFEELLILQLGLLMLKGRSCGKGALAPKSDYTDDFFKMLPFPPTAAQRRAVAEAVDDMMNGDTPMARLIQGDVGSGKTVVAAALCYVCAKSGIQSAMMAPTEILAEQHFATLCKMLEPVGIRIALLTGSMTAAQKKSVYQMLECGNIDIIVGTHALISKPVSFSNLGLVITDEQHRFGVAQRAALSSKGEHPHLLVMSATPIPRTLALMLFGDLDVSILDEMPNGRIPTETFWIDSGKRQRAYNFIKKYLDEGRQAFIVCPLVDGDCESELISAQDYAASLSAGQFRGYSVGLLHGKMKAIDKDYVMRRFLQGEIQLLVSTTVVEVGVDVPNAVIMLIENAERFGLSQLHQLRGRVGRGKYQSFCILVSDSANENSVYRMKTMVRTNDGFEISNEDLKLRGPGDFFGSRQHGLPQLRLADLESDMRAFSAAQAEARHLLDCDKTLSSAENSLLREYVERMFSDTTFN